LTIFETVMTEMGWKAVGDGYYKIEDGQLIQLSVWCKKGSKVLVDTRRMDFYLDSGLKRKEDCEDFAKNAKKIESAVKKKLRGMKKEELEKMAKVSAKSKKDIIEKRFAELADHEL